MADELRLIVGLGNPGEKYARTRHNVGFAVVDELAGRFGVTGWRTKHQAQQAPVHAKRALLLKPISFMNNSGIPVGVISSYYRTKPEDVLIIYDEMDLPFGKLRMRAAGGHAGHNGMRSLIAALGEGFPRLRIGIGRPLNNAIDHVLARFDDTESKALDLMVAAAADGVIAWLERGIEAAMQLVNAWELPDSFSSSPPSP